MTQELRKLRKLAERATPGYWSYSGREYADNGGTFETIEAETDTVIGEYSLSEKDARYIAAASPAAILALLDRVEKAEKDAARLDWVIRNRDMRVQGDDHRGWHVLDCSDGLTFVVREEGSFRSAIDSAMEASK